jgi:hypothetical protein
LSSIGEELCHVRQQMAIPAHTSSGFHPTL